MKLSTQARAVFGVAGICIGLLVGGLPASAAGVPNFSSPWLAAAKSCLRPVLVADSGRSVSAVYFPNGGALKKDGANWREYGADGKPSFTFVEKSRDDNMVTLRDDARDYTLQIDLAAKSVKLQQGKGAFAVLYVIARSEFIGTAVAAPAPAPAPVAQAPAAAQVPDDAVYEDVPDMTDEDVALIMHWIRTEVTGARLPYCWRQSKPRGAGVFPGRVADCPAGYTNNGATCGRGADTIAALSITASCPAGYTNNGPAGCGRGMDSYTKGSIFTKCRDGYRNDGFFCTRDVSLLGPDSFVCPDGYFKVNFLCHKNCPAGYTNTGETCFKGVDTLGIGSMLCKPGEQKIGARCFPAGQSCYNNQEEQTGLCYDKCAAGFDGAGPICWQACPKDWTGCAAGCGKTKAECAMTTIDQILGPVIIAANIATLGAATEGTAAADAGIKGTEETVQIAVKGGRIARWAASAGSKSGKLLGKAVEALQTVKPAGLEKGANVFKRIFAAKTGTGLKLINTGKQIAAAAHKSVEDYTDAYASEFDKNTSPDINKAIDENFLPKTALFLKKSWAIIQIGEMAETNHWVIAQDVMSAVSIVDISGVTGLVNAYAKPICQSVAPFPCVNGSLDTCKP